MFSIIICTYNRDKYIYDTLKYIAINDFSKEKYEIVLINNISTDNTEQEIFRFENDYPDIPIQYFVETNQGLSHARNRGIKEAKGDVLIFLDDDSFVAKDYLANLEENLKINADLAAFGGKIAPLFETGVPPAWLSKWTYSWVSAIDMGATTKLFLGKQYPIGANMGFTKACIEKYGTFNTALGRSKKNLMGGEEKDLFGRIMKNNEKVYYFPNIEVNHVIPESRTTKEYIIRMGQGIGMSEKLRTLDISKTAYQKRIFSEGIKWAASIILCLGYIFSFKPQKGTILITFRWNVSKGLLKK